MKKREAQQINAYHACPFSAFIEDAEDKLKDGEFQVCLEEKVETPLNKDNKPLEEGDYIWATGLFSETEQIQATALISQKLAEGFRQNSTSVTFDELPKMKPWDYAVELSSDANSKTCKVYPLSISKQAELDVFLKENLEY